MKEKQMEVLMVEPGKYPYVTTIENELEAMQKAVGGYIEAISLDDGNVIILNEEGKLLSMNIWSDENAVARWRNVMEHRMSQKEGRENLFESYRITVCSAIRTYSDTDRAQAPKDSNEALLP